VATGAAAATSLGRGPLLGRLGHDAAATYSKQIHWYVSSPLSHRVSYTKIFDDVEERVMREKEVVASRNNHLMNETTTS
jgi:hypothetical protein